MKTEDEIYILAVVTLALRMPGRRKRALEIVREMLRSSLGETASLSDDIVRSVSRNP